MCVGIYICAFFCSECYMHFTGVLGTSAWAGVYVTQVCFYTNVHGCEHTRCRFRLTPTPWNAGFDPRRAHYVFLKSKFSPNVEKCHLRKRTGGWYTSIHRDANQGRSA